MSTRATAEVPSPLESSFDRLGRPTRSNLLTQGHAGAEIPELLFVCVHNAGRSQMAATLLKHHARGTVHVRSAGSAPAGWVRALRELAPPGV